MIGPPPLDSPPRARPIPFRAAPPDEQRLEAPVRPDRLRHALGLHGPDRRRPHGMVRQAEARAAGRRGRQGRRTGRGQARRPQDRTAQGRGRRREEARRHRPPAVRGREGRGAGPGRAGGRLGLSPPGPDDPEGRGGRVDRPLQPRGRAHPEAEEPQPPADRPLRPRGRSLVRPRIGHRPRPRGQGRR